MHAFIFTNNRGSVTRHRNSLIEPFAYNRVKMANFMSVTHPATLRIKYKKAINGVLYQIEDI